MKNAVVDYTHITPGVGLNIHPPSPLKKEKNNFDNCWDSTLFEPGNNSNPNDDPALFGSFMSCPDYIFRRVYSLSFGCICDWSEENELMTPLSGNKCPSVTKRKKLRDCL